MKITLTQILQNPFIKVTNTCDCQINKKFFKNYKRLKHEIRKKEDLIGRALAAKK